jgi:hypothetical protein
VLIADEIEMTVFWICTPYSAMGLFWGFKTKYASIISLTEFSYLKIKMEAIHFSKTMGKIGYPTNCKSQFK